MGYSGKEWGELADLDLFFFYGETDPSQETQHDVALGLKQPPRSLFYDREDSAGVAEFENQPMGVTTEILLRYRIISWLGYRNRHVSDGSGDSRDRRVAATQDQVKVQSDGRGNMNVMIRYIPLGDLQDTSEVRVPLGGVS